MQIFLCARFDDGRAQLLPRVACGITSVHRMKMQIAVHCAQRSARCAGAQIITARALQRIFSVDKFLLHFKMHPFIISLLPF